MKRARMPRADVLRMALAWADAERPRDIGQLLAAVRYLWRSGMFTGRSQLVDVIAARRARLLMIGVPRLALDPLALPCREPIHIARLAPVHRFFGDDESPRDTTTCPLCGHQCYVANNERRTLMMDPDRYSARLHRCDVAPPRVTVQLVWHCAWWRPSEWPSIGDVPQRHPFAGAVALFRHRAHARKWKER